jgi:hypothetical protein
MYEPLSYIVETIARKIGEVVVEDARGRARGNKLGVENKQPPA